MRAWGAGGKRMNIENTMAETMTDTAANLRRLRVMTRSWGTDCLDAERCVHIARGEPEAVPVYWCFNVEVEFPHLADAVAGKHDLVGMRSLNKVLPDSMVHSGAAEGIARHYADTLFDHFGTRPCIIGGNCLAASIAYRVAVKLIARGVPVLRIISHDTPFRHPFPGHVRHLYGADAGRYNPFIGKPPPPDHPLLQSWRYPYPSYDWGETQGSHTVFFKPENMPSMLEAIHRPNPPHAPQCARATADRGPRHVKWVVKNDGKDHVTIETRALNLRGTLAMVAVWRKPDGTAGVGRELDWMHVAPRFGKWTCRLSKPKAPGPWTLRPVLCRLGQGPLQWPLEKTPGIEIR